MKTQGKAERHQGFEALCMLVQAMVLQPTFKHPPIAGKQQLVQNTATLQPPLWK